MADLKMNALSPILDYKRNEVANLKASTPLAELSAKARDQDAPRGFAAQLTRISALGDNALICELKRKSPSAGEICPGADSIVIAKDYERGGAACLSVLTDGPSFGGSLRDLKSIRGSVSLPILRKDFMIDPIQIVEARAYGADAILIIMGAVDDVLAKELLFASTDLGMDALIEVHNEKEMERALQLPEIGLLGINNRDLTIMKTDLNVTERLSRQVPETIPIVSESGVRTPDDIIRLRKVGAKRFLIGESLMLSENREDLVSQLRTAGTI